MIDMTEAQRLQCLTHITSSHKNFMKVAIACKGRDASMGMLSFPYLDKENYGQSLIQSNVICPVN